jgi:hypothetical protein
MAPPPPLPVEVRRALSVAALKWSQPRDVRALSRCRARVRGEEAPMSEREKVVSFFDDSDDGRRARIMHERAQAWREVLAALENIVAKLDARETPTEQDVIRARRAIAEIRDHEGP